MEIEYVTYRMPNYWVPRSQRLADLADEYWRLRKEGNEEGAAQVWGDMDSIPRDVGASEGDKLGALADFLDLDYSPSTHNGSGVSSSFVGWYGNISQVMGDDNTGYLVLTALYEAGAIPRDAYFATLDGPDVTYSWISRIELDGKSYTCSYAEGDFSINDPGGHFSDNNPLIPAWVAATLDGKTVWAETLHRWLASSFKSASYKPKDGMERMLNSYLDLEADRRQRLARAL